MDDIRFTAEAAGTMAQILAILLLASAYDPAYRNSVGVRSIVDQTGVTHDIPVTRGRFRLWLFAITLLLIGTDALIVMNGDGWFGLPALVLQITHGAPIGGLLLLTFMTIHEYAKHGRHEADGDR